MATQSVQIKSAMESKINWTQVVGVVASVATLFGFTVPPDMIPAVVTGIVAVQGLLTVVWKTWFTNTITPESAN